MRARVVLIGSSLVWGGIALTSMLLSTGGHLSMPLDDAYILFQFARRVAAGAPLTYQAGGGVTTGATSLLTVAVDAVGYLIGFRGQAMSVFAILLGCGALAWASLSALRIGRRLTPELPWLFPALLLACGPLAWGFLSGMDLPVLVSLALAFAASWPRPGESPPRRLFVFGALLGLARPDSLFLILPAWVLGFGFPSRRTWWLLPWAGVAFPFALQWVLTGSPQSSSMDVKSILATPGMTFGDWFVGGLSYLQTALRGILGGAIVRDAHGVAANDGSAAGFYVVPFALPLALLGFVPGAVAEGRRHRLGLHALLGTWCLLILLAVSFTVPRTWHWHRYLMPLYAFLLAGVAVGACRLGGWIDQAWGELVKGDGARLLGGSLLVLSLPGAAYFAAAYGRNCADIYFQHIELAERFRDARPVRPKILGLHDAGALVYFSGVRALDLEGLVSPAFRRAARLGSAGIWEAIERLPVSDRPDVLAVYPSWFDPVFLEPHHLILSQRLFRPSIAAGNPMNVYLADWSAAGLGNSPLRAEIRDLVQDLRLVAEVDVADVRSEDEAGYRLRVLDGAYQSILVGAKGGPDGGSVLDGGRVVSGSEEFTVRGLHRRDELILVNRTHAPFRVRVETNGRDAGIWSGEAPPAGEWGESAYALPPEAVEGETIRLRISPGDPHHSVYGSFHYWVYRR